MRQRQSNAEDCVRQILREVRAGRIRRSQRLSIGSMSSRLGFSHARVRMAFEQLKHLGVLEQRPRSGTYLRTLTMAEFVEITQLRAVLEGFVCTLACDRLTEAELSRLENLAAELDRDDPDDPDRDHDAVLATDLAFHSHIAQASGNRTLISILDTQRFISHYLEILPEMDLDRSVPVRTRHIDIVRALRARDAAKAEHLMREHVLWHSARKRRRHRSG